ncbi:MAG: oligopeptide transporter, OPT family, partial [Candidatus Aminicenantes bacterium]|nr:oligopeptide transporter, OPT family [Candidatus Aminicenantes bacterium]
GLIPTIAYFGEHLNIPLFPETELPIAEMTAYQIWNRYIRVIGAGAVAVAGIITVFKSIPTMYNSLKTGIKELSLGKDSVTQSEKKRSQTDLPISVLGIGALIVFLVIVFTPKLIGLDASIFVRSVAALCIVFFTFCFATVSSRIVGMVGVSSNPTSGMTIVTLLGTSMLFVAIGWTDIFGMVAALTVGTVVCVGSSIAGDISQDLKAGYILGATPRRQQASELVGVITSAFAIAAAVWILGEAFGFGTEALSAPQATLMKTVIEGVLGGNLPWGLVLIGGSFAVVSELLRIPSLPLAVGIYLPLSTMTPIYVGGFLRQLIEQKRGQSEEKKRERTEKGVLLGSGFIAGEGITMVLVALYAFTTKTKPQGLGIVWPGDLGQFVALAAFLALTIFLWVKTRK